MTDEILSKGKSEGEEPSLQSSKNYRFTKVCRGCGKEFRTNSPQKQFCDRQHYFPCPVCGTYVKYKYRDFTREAPCCSNECKHELRVSKMAPKICSICGEPFIATSGVSTICSKDHYRPCEICGKEFLITREHRDVTTCSSECSKEKTRRFYQIKYHADHPMQNPEVQKHHQAAMEAKHGAAHALQVNKFMKKQQETVVQTNMERHGVPYACMLPQCTESQGKIISGPNLKARSYLESLGLRCSLEKRIDNFSYDIVVESIKTVIEIDPTYTHSTINTHWKSSVTPDYHLRKTEVAAEQGYRCIHIFDWEDTHKILDMLKPRDSIYARKCHIYKLKEDVAKEFIEENHIQGNCRGQKLFLGLVYEGELYQVMSFGFSRYSRSHDIELLRLCTKQGYSVVGGASKLFKFAVEDYGLSNIVSYCDISKFDGSVYETIGMKFLRQTPPQEIWSKGVQHITANLLRQRGYDQLFKTNYGKGTDNEQLMLDNGWLPVYDCGMKVFEYK